MSTAGSTPRASDRPRLVVVGGRGFLGQRLAAHAAPQWDVNATYHRSPPVPLEGVRWTELDVRDDDAIAAVIGHERPAVIVNCAYVQRGDDLHAITGRAPGVMATAANQAGARFVQLSSDVVFRGRTDRAYVEHDRPAPVHEYGRAKAAAEATVVGAAPDALIVRTSLLYGGPHPGPQELLVTGALAGQSVVFYTDEVRCPILVDELAAALLELVDHRATGLFHVAGADAVDRLTFAQLLAGAMGRDPSPLRGRPLASSPEARPSHVALDCTKARRVLRRTTLTGARALSRREPRSGTD